MDDRGWSPELSGGRIVVVGAGPAGRAAATQLRELGFTGSVALLADEPPYDRTACSKGLLTGHQTPRDLDLDLPGGPVQMCLGERVVQLDLAQRVISTTLGRQHAFDALVVATGARPVLPSHWPVGEPGVHALHTRVDGWSIRGRLRHAGRVAVVGGGLTGCEAACAIRGLGREVVIIDSRPTLMHRALGDPLGAIVTASHRARGIDAMLGRRVSAIERDRRCWRVVLDDGQRLAVDLVLLTAGEQPDTGWLSGCGLNLADGVRCDESLRVLDRSGRPVPGIVAAGAVARWPNLRVGLEPMRCGQWIAAAQLGQGAAATLLAGDGPARPVAVLPRWWSHQDELRIQGCGEIAEDAEVTISQLRPGRADAARGGVVATYRRDGRLIGLLAINAADAFVAVARTLRTDFSPVPELAGPGLAAGHSGAARVGRAGPAVSPPTAGAGRVWPSRAPATRSPAARRHAWTAAARTPIAVPHQQVAGPRPPAADDPRAAWLYESTSDWLDGAAGATVSSRRRSR